MYMYFYITVIYNIIVNIITCLLDIFIVILLCHLKQLSRSEKTTFDEKSICVCYDTDLRLMLRNQPFHIHLFFIFTDQSTISLRQ